MTITVKQLQKEIGSDFLVAIGHSIAGGLAGVVASTILYPMNQISTRKVAKSGRILTFQIILNDFKNLQNIGDIYKGLQFNVIQAFLFQGVFFFIFEAMKQNYIKLNPNNPTMSPMSSIFRGSFAGLLTQFIVTPLKVLQIRFQTSETNETPLQIIESILEEDGATGILIF